MAFLIQDDKVIRAQNTELVVFFPTEKKTELGFLIQGPFKTTKARDNIAKSQDCEANKQLIETAAQLAAYSLEELRDLGLIKVESYNALPLRASDFPAGSIFRPIYDAVQTKLKTSRLLLRYGGGFVSASEARLARGKELAELFSPTQLGSLFANDIHLYWLDTATTADRMPDLHRYLVGKRKAWPSNEWEQSRLSRALRLMPKTWLPSCLPTFLAQDESWLVRFYAYLEKNFELFKNTPFVRLESRQVESQIMFCDCPPPQRLFTTRQRSRHESNLFHWSSSRLPVIRSQQVPARYGKIA